MNHSHWGNASGIRKIFQAHEVLYHPSQYLIMKLISWNIRGLNCLGKYRLIKSMIQQEKPSIFFIQETKCNSVTLEKTMAKAWPGYNAISVDASGASGGLEIIWNAQTITLSNMHANKHFIQATFHITGTNIHGHLTNVYFPQEAMYKIEILNNLSIINAKRTHPLWITVKDFNMITKLEEKRGGRSRLDKESCHLKNFIQNNKFFDIPFNNGVFTWNNKRVGPRQITSRLDRFLLSNNAIHLGRDLSASILPLTGSDHWPIALQWTRPGNTARRPFHFEAFWLSHPDFNNFINMVWKSFIPLEGSKMFQFQ